MQCNTTSPARQPEVEPLAPPNLENWEDLLRYLPPSVALEASARSAAALLRRREVKGAADLLRLVLGYAVCDWPLRILALWWDVRGLGHLSAEALRKRLQHCSKWLGMLIVALLQARQFRLPCRGDALQLRIQDATVISRPGSQSTDWRLHLSLNVGQARIDGIELTDAHGGETLARFPLQPGEIRLVDRGYAHPGGLGSLLQEEGQVVVRINWQNLRLEEEDGRRFAVATWLGAFEGQSLEARERSVWLVTPQGRFPLRLVACPLPPEKAEEARRRARQTAQKKKHQVDARTLLAAGFVLLLTNLPASQWSAPQVLELYRLRWQVEILIKRLKSVLALDGLRAQTPALAQTYLLGKMLGALLLQEMTGQVYCCVPDDWDVQARPLSPWRLTIVCQEILKQLIQGPLTQGMIRDALSRLLRFLSEGPRKRASQGAWAAHLLQAMSGC